MGPVLDWSAILSGSSAAAVLLIVVVVVVRSMGARLLSLHDDERQEIKDSLDELADAIDENQQQLTERTTALEKRQQQIKHEINEKHQNFEKKVMQKFSDLPEDYVPRRELGTKLDNIRKSQEHIKENTKRISDGLQNLRKQIASRG